MAITVFSKPGCVACRMTERALNKAGADYEVKDATDNVDKIRQLGFASAPVVVPDSGDDHAWSGFRDEKIQQAVQEQRSSTPNTSLVEQLGMTGPPSLTAQTNSSSQTDQQHHDSSRAHTSDKQQGIS